MVMARRVAEQAVAGLALLLVVGGRLTAAVPAAPVTDPVRAPFLRAVHGEDDGAVFGPRDNGTIVIGHEQAIPLNVTEGFEGTWDSLVEPSLTRLVCRRRFFCRILVFTAAAAAAAAQGTDSWDSEQVASIHAPRTAAIISCLEERWQLRQGGTTMKPTST